MKRTGLLLFLFLNIFLSFSQNINLQVKDDRGRDMLLGVINKDGLSKAPFDSWFSKNLKDYEVNEKITTKLKDYLKDYTIKAFLGTWCGDSKKEIPRLYSVLESANFPEKQLEIIALDRSKDKYKQGPNGEEKGMHIHRVPTIILYKDGKEINRIVEHPKETLERDLLNIVSGKRYTSNYAGANYIQQLLAEKTIDSLQLMENQLVSWLGEVVKGTRELNTTGYVYLRAKELDKALYIFHLNTKIFPYSYRVYDSLGEAYFETENYMEALKAYYKVLSLKPEDKNALEMIEKIKLKTP